MKERILITGYSGSLAKEVVKLLENKYELFFLTTNQSKVDKKNIFFWDPNKNKIDKECLKKCQHIIHLSGYSILKRWSKKNKKIMYQSRVEAAKMIFEKCKEFSLKPKTFISASAMGIYPENVEGEILEESAVGSSWLSKMAIDWENAAENFKKIKCRVVIMRISLLMDRNSGILKYNIMSTKLGLAGIIGSSNQIINWIHINDAARFIVQALKNKKYIGTYNLATDNPLTQKQFIQIIKNNIFKYAIVIKMPFQFLKLLAGGRSTILKFGKKKLNVERLLKLDFKYKYSSFQDIFSKANQ